MIYRKSLFENVVLSTKWDNYHGFTPADEAVVHRIYDLAGKLMDMHGANAERYPMKGEWYAIREHEENGKKRLGVRRVNSAYVTTRIMAVALVLQFLLAMSLTTAMIMITRTPTVEWLSIMCPETARTTLLHMFISVEYAGCALLFMLFPRRRSAIALLSNTLVPFCIAISVGLTNRFWWMYLAIPAAVIGASLIAVLWNLFFEERDDGYLTYARSALIICGLVLICVSNYFAIFGYPHKEYVSAFSSMDDKQALYYNIELCQRLEEQAWDTLDLQEKTELLQAISDYECIFILGCEPVRLQIGDTHRKNVLGEYHHATRCITIDEEHVRSDGVTDVLDTLLHETRHVYQNNLVDMYQSLGGQLKEEYVNLLPFRQAQEYSLEFDAYCHGEDDFTQYYNQEVERDSREWADKRLREYYFGFVYPDR